MNTPAHLIFGLTAFGRTAERSVIAGALAGSLLPDLSLYLLAGTHLLVLGTGPDVVFGQLYYSEGWQSIFRIDNSFILWGLALFLAVLSGARWAVALCGAALLHLTLDFAFHNDDGRSHFWPVTEWIFVSPVSYWDPDHFGGIVGPLEVLAALACCVLLWRRFRSVGMRVLIALLAVAEALPGIVFAIMFAGQGG